MSDSVSVLIKTDTHPKEFGMLWTIAEHQTTPDITWDKNSFRDKLFLHPLQLNGSIRGNDLYEYFKEKQICVLNACVLEFLKDNPGHIPDEWKMSSKGNAQYIFFWGTLDRSPDGNLYVRYLTWTGGNWTVGNYLLSGNWHEDFPAAVYEK